MIERVVRMRERVKAWEECETCGGKGYAINTEPCNGDCNNDCTVDAEGRHPCDEGYSRPRCPHCHGTGCEPDTATEWEVSHD